MLVELDAFSGRPNPRWELDEQGSRELRLLEKRLTPVDGPAPEPPGLGYRGYVYSNDSGQVRAYRGFVTTCRAVLADPSRTVERYLTGQLPADHGEIRDWIAAEIAPK